MASRTVQHVPKASSDELLRKFPASESESWEKPLEKTKIQRRKRRKISRIAKDRDHITESPVRNSSLVEWKCLLPHSNRRTMLLRQLGIKRSEFGRNGFFLAAMEKTWRKTIEGASKMFAEKHYNRHIRLISDVV